jgi:type IV pilus assembly protein PilO
MHCCRILIKLDLGRSLQFELFRPGQVVVKEYYAELPISVKITGSLS